MSLNSIHVDCFVFTYYSQKGSERKERATMLFRPKPEIDQEAK